MASAAVLIMGISLVESSFYLNAIVNGVSGDLEGLHLSLNLILSIQHAYSIIPAPVFDAGLGIVLFTSTFLKDLFVRILGCLGIAFSVVLVILGFIGTFTNLQQVINNVLTVQQIWLIAITLAIALSTRHAPNNSPASQPDVIVVPK